MTVKAGCQYPVPVVEKGGSQSGPLFTEGLSGTGMFRRKPLKKMLHFHTRASFNMRFRVKAFGEKPYRDRSDESAAALSMNFFNSSVMLIFASAIGLFIPYHFFIQPQNNTF
jgi:hypothetical protein